MMVPIAQVKAGLETYIQQEILSKTSGLPRWGVGALLGIVFKKSDNLIEAVRANKFVKALGLIDESGGVDVETIFGELKKQAAKEDAVVDLSMMGLPLGTLTLKAADVEALYQAIRAAAA